MGTVLAHSLQNATWVRPSCSPECQVSLRHRILEGKALEQFGRNQGTVGGQPVETPTLEQAGLVYSELKWGAQMHAEREEEFGINEAPQHMVSFRTPFFKKIINPSSKVPFVQ